MRLAIGIRAPFAVTAATAAKATALAAAALAAKATALAAAALVTALLCPAPAAAEGSSGLGGDYPRYALSVSAEAGFLGLAGADGGSSALLPRLEAEFLHRVSGEGWGLVLSHGLDLSGFGAAGGTAAGTAAVPASAGAASTLALLSIHEAYVRLDLDGGDLRQARRSQGSDKGGAGSAARGGSTAAEGGDSHSGEAPALEAQLFIGKRRMGLGIGTSFAPGDLLNPRDGFWDQKTGFRGLAAAASLGPDLSLRAALSLEGPLAAWEAGAAYARALAAAAQAGLSAPALAQATAARDAAGAAYTASLRGAESPLDPRLLLGAVSAELLLDRLHLAASAVYAPDEHARPSLGLSLDISGLILQAEAAYELETDSVFATAGLKSDFSWESLSLSLALDYLYNGQAGLLRRSDYLLPSLSLNWEKRFGLTARSLIGLDDSSALAFLVLTLYPREGLDLECSLRLALGDEDSEFGSLGGALLPQKPEAGSAGPEPARAAFGLIAKIYL